MKHQILYPIMSLLFVSCSSIHEETGMIEHVSDSSGITMVTASTTPYRFDDDLSTRGLTYDGNGVPFAWTVKDTLGIFPDKGDQISFSLSEGVGTDYAIIDGGGWALKRTSSYAGYYPFNRKNYYKDRQHVELDYTGQVETGIANADHLGAYDYQATNDTKAVNDRLSFQFKRLSCIWILRLTVPQAGSYTAIKVSAENPIFTKRANLSLGNQYVFTPIEMTKVLYLGLKNVTTTSDNQIADFLMMLGPVDMTGQGITVTLISANGCEYKATRTLSSNFSAGAVKRSAFTLVLDSSSNVGLGGEFIINDDEM